MESQFDIDLSGDLPPGVQPGSLGGADMEAPGSADEPVPLEQEAAEQPTDVPWNGEVADGSLDGVDPEEEEEPTVIEVSNVGLPAEEGGPGYEELQHEREAEAAYDPNGVGAALDEQMDAALGDEFAGDAAEMPQEPDAEPEVETPVESPSESPKPKKARAKRKAAAATQRAAPSSKSGTVDRLYYIFEEVQAEVDGQVVTVYVQRAFSVNGDVIQGIRTRNRDLALAKAGKMWDDTEERMLVAVVESMWDVQPVQNEPHTSLRTRVGRS